MTDKSNAELLQDATKKLQQVSDEYSKTAENALKEAQNAGSLSAETKEIVDKLATQHNSLQEAVKTLQTQLGETEQHIANMPLNGARQTAETAGQLVAQAENVKAMASQLEQGKSARVPVQNALTSPDVAEGVVEPERLPGIDQYPKQRLFIRDLIAPGRTSSPAIFWVQQTGFTNNAAPVAENTTKPYSDIEFATKITPVQTIAHMFKASKQILDDMAQLQSTVDAEMRYGLKYVEEQQILFGDGTGQNLEGIIPQASDFDPAFAPDSRNKIDDLRLAMLQAQLARIPASAHVLHFMDWAEIELTKDANGRYIFANPTGIAGPVMWGLPVVATEANSLQGNFLTGAFQAGAQLFDREDANVVISSENADDFEKNMISIRCEERLALAVKRPEAFVYGQFGKAVASDGGDA